MIYGYLQVLFSAVGFRKDEAEKTSKVVGARALIPRGGIILMSLEHGQRCYGKTVMLHAIAHKQLERLRQIEDSNHPARIFVSTCLPVRAIFIVYGRKKISQVIVANMPET